MVLKFRRRAYRSGWHDFIITVKGIRAFPTLVPGEYRQEFERGLILSGNDLTAREFVEYTESSSAWRGLLQEPKVTRMDLPKADHTFSQRPWLDRVSAESIAWLQQFSRT
jgi:hypothetical protein